MHACVCTCLLPFMHLCMFCCATSFATPFPWIIKEYSEEFRDIIKVKKTAPTENGITLVNQLKYTEELPVMSHCLLVPCSGLKSWFLSSFWILSLPLALFYFASCLLVLIVWFPFFVGVSRRLCIFQFSLIVAPFSGILYYLLTSCQIVV